MLYPDQRWEWRLKCIAIIGRHPSRWVPRHRIGVTLQLRQVVEAIVPAQLGAVHQTHEQAADLGALPVLSNKLSFRNG
jgi:hypothetical protein